MAKKNETPKAEKQGTVCPVTREQFARAAKPLLVDVGEGQAKLVLGVKTEFSSGSFGYHMSDKVTLMIGDVPVKFQANLQLIAVGSKPAKDAE